MRNPKAEGRNPKEARNPNSRMSGAFTPPRAPTSRFQFPSFLRPSAFGFRLSDFLRPSAFGLRISTTCALLAWSATHLMGATFEDTFREGVAAYRIGDYAASVKAFQQSTRQQLASGTLRNLGNAEWKLGRAGPAILAWERALWLDPFDEQARMDLRFGRKTAQLETPELSWYEVISTWLPANWWAWIAGASLWLAVALVMLPGILRLRKTTWHQAVAAFCLMVFLLSVPAYAGLHTRSRIGFVLQPDTPLRLTPTLEAQSVTRLASGEPARLVRTRGDYVLIRTNHTLGWVGRGEFALACAPSKP